ncbi:DNA mismatch repair protein MLH1 [Diplonema papillatum]|nr:DNA mismatch repair protein MLH1 [Diplonema papillatum]
MANDGVIRKLPEDVVNRIAAGEVLQRPCHAVKELLENALDAGGTQISVMAKNGGIKLTVTDNGCGIRYADMTRVCERFTTSKLTKYEDLASIQTFGFRGEALASMTYVARVSITSRRRGASSAHTASYQNGRMKEKVPAMVANPEGTTICIDDLFHSHPVRKMSLRSPSTEYSRILEVVKRYAVANPKCAFTCRKDFGQPADLTTAGSADALQVIATIFGRDVGKSLIPVLHSEDGFTITGYVSSTDWCARRAIATYFVNTRLVDCPALHKSVMQAYSPVLGKGKMPFTYFEITVAPDEVDVNVHPTKAEVALLREDAIASVLHEKITEQLAAEQDKSREFATVARAKRSLEAATQPPAKESRIALFRPEIDPTTVLADKLVVQGTVDFQATASRAVSGPSTARPRLAGIAVVSPCQRVVLRMKEETPQRIFDVFQNAELVGSLPEKEGLQARSVVLQSFDEAWLVDTIFVLRDVAAQMLLKQHPFAKEKHPSLVFDKPPKVADLCNVALGIPGVWEPTDGPKDMICAALVACVSRHRDVLSEMGISVTKDDRVESIPRVWPDFIPPLATLPLVLLRIGSDVPWELGDRSETVFASLAAEMAALYSPLALAHSIPPTPSTDPLLPHRLASLTRVNKPVGELFESCILPSIRSLPFYPPAHYASSGAAVQLTTAAALHVTFERSHCR